MLQICAIWPFPEQHVQLAEVTSKDTLEALLVEVAARGGALAGVVGQDPGGLGGEFGRGNDGVGEGYGGADVGFVGGCAGEFWV